MATSLRTMGGNTMKSRPCTEHSVRGRLFCLESEGNQMVECDTNFSRGKLQRDYQTGVTQMLVHHSANNGLPKVTFLLTEKFLYEIAFM